jgi:signal transduction histidine kinase/ligand-binding sensor domain-containing protein/DNA-binding response OmpR family regulator
MRTNHLKPLNHFFFTRLNIWLLGTILLLSSMIKAQEYHVELVPAVRNGELPNIDINCIAQDSLGFLWIGTWKGLFRYDGREVTNYSLLTKNEIGRKISSLYIDVKGNLWIGTYSEGLFHYNLKSQKISSFLEINGIKAGNIINIGSDARQKVLVSSYDGIFSFDLEKGSFEEKVLTYTEEGNTFRLTATCYDSQGNLWVGSDQGILKYDKKAGKLINTGQLSNKYIHRILELDNGWLIASNLGGSDLFEEAEGQLIHHQNNPIGKALGSIEGESNYSMQSKSVPGQLWTGTHYGLFIFDLRTGSRSVEAVFKSDLEKKTNLHIESIYEDRQGIVWVGTNNGLYKYDRNRKPFYMQTVGGETGYEVTTLSVNGKNAFWAGTRGDGIYYIEADNEGHPRKQRKLILSSPALNEFLKEDIFSLESSYKDELWISIKGKGIIRLRNPAINDEIVTSNDVEHFDEENGLPDNHVMTIYRDNKGVIWGGSWSNGLLYYSPAEEKFIRIKGELAKDLRRSPIAKIIEAGPNSFYLGTRGDGLVRVETNSSRDSIVSLTRFLHQPSDPQSICNNFISDFVMMPGNNLWIATEFGISMLNHPKDVFVNSDALGDLQETVIQSLIDVSENEVWAATENGLNKIMLVNSLPGEKRNYNKYDGLDVTFFNTSCGLRLENGFVYFGGMEGISYMNPLKVMDSKSIPSLLITQIRLLNEVLVAGEVYDGIELLDNAAWFTRSIRFKHFQNTLSFSFSGMDFSVPEKISYAYMLEGLENEWVVSEEPVCYYPRLKHGDYILKVKCSNGDGIWNNDTTTLQITILPPWWLSKTAYFIYALLFIFIIYLVYRLITYRQYLRIKQLEQEQEIELFDMRIRFYTSISHEFRTPLTVIIGLIGRLRLNDDPEKRKDFHEKIDRNARILLRLITDLMDLRKVEKEEIRLRKNKIDPSQFFKQSCESFAHLFPTKEQEFLYIDKLIEPCIINGDPDRLESVVYNLLSNAFKYTAKGGQVSCELQRVRKVIRNENVYSFFSKTYETKDFLLFKVSDNGIGMTRAQARSVFDKYKKNKSYNSGESNTTSYGIGLVFTKSLVELHQGIIEVESEKRKGTTVFVYLPYQLVNDQQIPLKAEPEGMVQIMTGSRPEKSEIQERVGKHADEKIVLVIDDNPEVRELLIDILSPEYTILEAADGLEGWNKACEIVPDLIISDVLMPEMDGNQLCEKLKSSNITNHIPVILLTALPTTEDRIKGLKHGADSYIPKPFEVEHLLVRVEKLIRSRTQLKDKYMKDFLVKPEKGELPEKNPSAEYIARIKKLIEKNMTNSEYDVADLCKDLGTSRMQLYRKLKATVGYSANELIRKIRLHKAAELLLTSELNIAQVTYDVGFTDLQYFRKCFKEEFEMTPSQYVRLNSKDNKQSDQIYDPFDQD